jgi:hypothetical protein
MLPDGTVHSNNQSFHFLSFNRKPLPGGHYTPRAKGMRNHCDGTLALAAVLGRRGCSDWSDWGGLMGRHTGNREVVENLQKALEAFLADHYKAGHEDPRVDRGSQRIDARRA